MVAVVHDDGVLNDDIDGAIVDDYGVDCDADDDNAVDGDDGDAVYDNDVAASTIVPVRDGCRCSCSC